MTEKYYSVWAYYLPSTRYVKGFYSPVFTSKTDAERYAQTYVMNNKRRGACVVRCQKGYSNVQIYMNGNEFEPHYIYSTKLGKVVHNKEREKYNEIYLKPTKSEPAPFGL